MPGVYISYPFCSQKCTFCNFASHVYTPELRTRYQSTLLKQLQDWTWPWKPDTLYVGGGTPSLMPLEFLEGIVHQIPNGELVEATLECAPGTVTEESVREWARCGINRVSLGVQSFITAELRQTGRSHTAVTVEQDMEMLRRSGIENVNIDLIAGLPGQTRESWEESLDWIRRLSPPHVSVYVFEADDDSRLGRELSLGGVRYGAELVPSDDLVAEFYERAVDALQSIGLHRYEISNFSRPGSESRHNLKYWLLEPYVGFGLDAHSFDGTRRWSTSDDLNEYFAQIEASKPLPAISSDRAEERFFVGLRLMNGIAPEPSERARFDKPIAKWLKAGMLEKTDGRLRLSRRGVLLSNEIFQEFIDV